MANPAVAAASLAATRWPMLCPAGHTNTREIPAARSSPTFVRFFRKPVNRNRIVCTDYYAGGGPHENADQNPYEFLGVSSIQGFDKLKFAYARKRKDAERRGDEDNVAELDKAYERIIMSELHNRKKGLTYGLLEVPKEIKYADRQPIVPWAPRYSKSSSKDMRINMAISAVFIIWVLVQRNAEWKPLQFLAFAFFYRIFEKIKAFEPAVAHTLDEFGEEKGRGLRIGKRMLRSLALVFGCIALSSLGYTGLLDLIEYTGHAIPLFVYHTQELWVTLATSILSYVVASYFR